MSRIRLSYANVVATLALALAMSGGALAATHYLITSTHQIAPRVLQSLRQGPAVFAVHNNAGYTLTAPGDGAFHSIATLPIPRPGNYVVTAKVTAAVNPGGGLNQAIVVCTLAAPAGSPAASYDSSSSYLAILGDQQTLSLEVTHSFHAPGTAELDCQQNGTFGPGTKLSFTGAKVIATQAGSLRDTSVSH